METTQSNLYQSMIQRRKGLSSEFHFKNIQNIRKFEHLICLSYRPRNLQINMKSQTTLYKTATQIELTLLNCMKRKTVHFYQGSKRIS